jgi:hypothetical protein
LGTQPQFQFEIGFFKSFLVDGKFKGLSNKPLHAKLGPLLWELWSSKNSFHLRARHATQNTSSNIFLENKIKLCHVRKVHTYKGSFGSFHSD